MLHTPDDIPTHSSGLDDWESKVLWFPNAEASLAVLSKEGMFAEIQVEKLGFYKAGVAGKTACVSVSPQSFISECSCLSGLRGSGY